jgi:hypothetical protein
VLGYQRTVDTIIARTPWPARLALLLIAVAALLGRLLAARSASTILATQLDGYGRLLSPTSNKTVA